MELLYNNNVINEIVSKLFRHRRNDYSELQAEHLASALELTHELLPVANPNFEKLMVSLFSKHPLSELQTCILFLHGYGSNRLECTNLLRFIAEHKMALCSLDFSGSGKSQGDSVTYGIKEKEDIDCTLSCLRKRGFRRFVLWGRSMGATSALLYSVAHRPSDVVLQVVDSPFYTFEMIAFEIASKNVKAPDFVISFALDMAKKNCQKFEFNPFDINLESIGSCKVPALFVYCQEDSVINCCNTHLICQRYRAVYEKLVIPENHNTVRSSQTIAKIFSYISKYTRQTKQKQKQSPGLFSSLHKSKSMESGTGLFREDSGIQDKRIVGKKGIRRVESIHPQTQKFDDYGIWVASKVKDEELGKKKTKESLKRLQISLNSSIAVRSENQRGTKLEEERTVGSFIYGGSFMSGRKEKLKGLRSSGMSVKLTNSRYL